MRPHVVVREWDSEVCICSPSSAMMSVSDRQRVNGFGGQADFAPKRLPTKQIFLRQSQQEVYADRFLGDPQAHRGS